MNILIVAKRILRQFLRDKRSVALMVVAPGLILSLLWLVLDNDSRTAEVAVVEAPEQIYEQLASGKMEVSILDEKTAQKQLNDAEIDALLKWDENRPLLILEGSDPTDHQMIRTSIQEAMGVDRKEAVSIQYWHGSEDMNFFDYTGPVLIGFFIFFFVFLVGGVSFLRERTQGTLERVLATPIQRYELVGGYLLGFGLFTLLQSVLIVLYSVYVLDMYMVGEMWMVLFITMLLALTALSLGTLLSTYAKNEFQMIQFIPLVIVPQLFFSGLFPIEGLSSWVQVLGKLMPLTYGAEALRGIMLRNENLGDLQWQVFMLLMFFAIFTLLNVKALRRHRNL
ncbi:MULTISPECIES: ABC transporter permease [Salimicrobium]|uniref:ABC transporter permease n=3 Tax=Salimicrobium TaxID=351195 RepID=K2H7H5_9BACI|nr:MULTISPECIES: ABC transporter permease [Salimicrobium]AKG04929.1 ABC transporter permease [Salimicrobium jeotgali]EKE31605.1 ABC-type transport system permease [Salimicrobium jeotgali]MBM7696426.1 ABC-2 type transport system permease protein [Salimicrobium jeotgali]SDX43883.1 ABC-2 type transport system permease protein [Salimicrobium album]SIS45559.1 ABC-2 type transport system permease protein [Salimicrobium salexigens]